ncbi:MAG: NADH-quinone oxidoreductase subunit L [Chitinophagaceae bacterium]|nr:NADH-quinone oxidoreductase subunit L [Chitinophagaceae bacterium]
MQNVLQIVYLIPLLPLIGFLINGLGRKHLSKSMISAVGCGSILISFALSIWVFLQVKGGNVHTAHYFDFISVGKLKIPFEFKIDQLSSLFLLIITGIGFLIHLYSTSYMKEEKSEHFGRYFSYLNLFIFSMLLLVMGGNFVVMFIGWEGVGLCSYLLIGFWFKKHEYNKAASKAFIMNRIGDLAFLIAIFWLIAKLSTVSFDEVFTAANIAKLSSLDITVITILLFVGATGKSAQIPLYTWLPDAMAGPTPVSALIHAATMVTAGIYMIARSNILYSLSVIHAMGGEQDIRNMGGLSKKLKITFITFLIGCIAIAGIPPFSGFFSKDAILLSAFIKNPVLYGVALFAALLTAFYMFRLLFITFSGKFRGTHDQEHHLHESPPAMTIPLIVLAILAIIGGFVGIPEVFMHGGDKLGEFLSPVITEQEHHVSHATEYMLMGLSTGLVIAMIIFAWFKFRNYQRSEATGFGKVLENKWYVDEIYDAAIVKPIKKAGTFFSQVFDNKVIDGMVNGVGRLMQYSSRQLRLVQSGQVGNYVLLMVISMVLIFVIQFFLRK